MSINQFITERTYLTSVSATPQEYRSSFKAFSGALESKVMIVQRIAELHAANSADGHTQPTVANPQKPLCERLVTGRSLSPLALQRLEMARALLDFISNSYPDVQSRFTRKPYPQ